MTVVEVSYLGFAALGGVAVAVLPVRVAILLVFLGGWLLLPVGVYPDSVAEATFPWWITGVAVPSEMLLTKGWVAPVVALGWALVRDGPRLLAWRPSPFDLPVVLWCLWPAASALTVAEPDPAALVAVAYLAGTWGAPWMLGRVWFADSDGRLTFLKGLALAGLGCLPFAVLEGAQAPWLYSYLFDDHPFQTVGHGRPFGSRPLGFFEDGNQYALWIALCAVAAVWVGWVEARAGGRAVWPILGAVVAVMALAAQGRGAILLMALCLVLLVLWRFRLGWGVFVAVTGGALVIAGLHVSGVVPIRQIIRGTEAGRQFLVAAREAGLGTVAWRIGQDVRTLDLILEAPWFGAGRWDWSHGSGTRPWGLWLLAAGQYGLVAAGMALLALVAPALARLRDWRRRRVWRAQAAAVPLALIALAAMADAWLNSWLFFPALVAAGALVVPTAADRGDPAA
ncbi:hypothetical protein [Rhodobaculum claviforme]|uniref:O-antigen ligase like membrane protein n=1 Tax=Rhodobaculum claviforme TaxID=1549854 RepID=A0A934WI25_9RHOB|nr:hypothetical protein [Rhodobaculum claviforme]MBK5926312.1 hypothetical protein [Rhodobaculum claviforme]